MKEESMDGVYRGVISGYFNPIGKHHIDYIKDARNILTDIWKDSPQYDKFELIAIVNNDEQVKLKGSVPFQDQYERHEIISNIKGIDRAIISIDTDLSVTQTLEMIRPSIVFNGGDRNTTRLNLKEVEFCRSIGCRIMTGVGGDTKTGSSSETIERAAKWFQWYC